MFELYLIYLLGTIKIMAVILMTIFGFGFIIGGFTKEIFNPVRDEEDYRISNIIFRISKPIFIVTLFLSIVIPKEKKLYTIFGIGTIIDVVQNSEIAKQLPDKTIQVLDKWCDEYLNDSE